MKTAFGSTILDAACRLLVPFMLLFALYVVAHGHDSPGGGFQGGTIIAATIILMRMVRGHGSTWGLSRLQALRLACLGIVVYAGLGFLSLFCGGNYLDYGVLPLPLPTAQVRAMGILGIEIGVVLGVAGVFVLIFDALTMAGEEDE
jgi:multicomponent Na+:H+ antiporter subunit B